MLIEASHHSHLSLSGWRWQNFSPAEIACKGSGAVRIDAVLLDHLEGLRQSLNMPLRLSSAYRSPKYNALVSSTGLHGPHTTGLAVDVLVSGAAAFDLVRAAMLREFRGIGVAQRGPHEKRFIHLDLCPAGDGCPRPWLWTYV